MNNKQNLVIFSGIGLIALVFLVTLFRPIFIQKNDKSVDEVENKIETFDTIAPDQLQQKIFEGKEKLLLIDVRSLQDFQTVHIIDSENTALESLSDRLSDFTEDAAIIIGYGNISGENEAISKAAGKSENSNIFILSGGISRWIEDNYSTISYGDVNSFEDGAKVNHISAEELKKLFDENYPVFVLDTRSADEFSKEKIRGAVNIPLDQLEKRRGEMPLTKKIAVYASDDERAFQSGVRLFDLNFFTVDVLSGGLAAWKEKGFETEK